MADLAGLRNDGQQSLAGKEDGKFLAASGYEIVEVVPRFLPLTIKSRLPVWPALIRLYLSLPFRPLGKQMLVVARPGPAGR